MWFPFAGFRRTAAHWRERLSLAVSAPFERVKADIVRRVELAICHPTEFAQHYRQQVMLSRASRRDVSKIDPLELKTNISNGQPAHFVSVLRFCCIRCI